MTAKEIEVYKKIVRGLDDMTKEKIADYKPGDKVESPSTKIVIGGNITEWRLSFYPGGNSTKYKDSIGLYLTLKQAGSRSFNAKFILGIVGKNGNKEWEREHTGESFKGGWGAPDLLKREVFRNPDTGYLVDGKVWMYCKLPITAKKTPEGHNKASLKQNQLNDFKRMLDDELFTDFAIETSDGKVLKAHMNILAFRSPPTYAVLISEMKETKDKVVKVTEDSAVMKEVLRFIYDEVEDEVEEVLTKLRTWAPSLVSWSSLLRNTSWMD